MATMETDRTGLDQNNGRNVTTKLSKLSQDTRTVMKHFLEKPA